MGRLRLQLFGGLQAHREGGADSALAGRKAQALLAYLALNPKQRCTRDRLATLLWSDRGEEQARQSLRQAVRSLHKALHDESAAILVSDGDRLTLDPEAIAVDVQAFERLSAANTREALEQARALYAGEFLEGIDVRSQGFEEWLAAERARLRDLAADVQQRLAQMYLDSGEWDAALAAAQTLLALDPLREEGHRILMRLYDRTGRRSLALRQYRICEETVRRELDASPAPETVRLHSEIRARNGEMTGNADGGKATTGEEPRFQGREPGRPQRAERKLTTILAADIAGYGRLMGADEEGTIARIKALRRELIDPKIEEHCGRIVKTTGDGVLVEFPSVVEAVRCAVEVQRSMVDRNVDLQQNRRIEFRVGVNLGDIIVEGEDIYGDGVNIAARLEALAEPGGICLSRAVRDHIRDKLPYEFADLGEQMVKNIARPVRVFGLAAKAVAVLPEIATAPPAPSSRRPAVWMYAAAATVVIAAIGVGVWRAGLTPAPQATGPTAGIPSAPHLSIVVLPFVNLSNDPDQEYFVDGITDNITTDVSHIADGFVIARNTAFTYKGKAVDEREIGRELGVRYVLEGSVQRLANQVRVNAQLIDAETGAHLWAESFDRERGDLFAIQDEITKRIAYALNLQLVNIEARRAERRSTSADAMDYIMRAAALLQQPLSKENYRAQAELYERALQLDEHLPRALTGMADALSSKVLDEFSDAPEDDLRRADELVSRALAIDPNYYYAHQIKGNILRIRKRYDEAIVEYETVIALNPMHVTARSHLARVKILIGEPAEAIPLLEQAMRISPRGLFPGMTEYRLGLANLLLGNTDEAIRWYNKAVVTDFFAADAYRDLAAALALKGDKAAAQAALAEAIKRNPNNATIAKVRTNYQGSDRPKFVELRERTLIAGLRKAGMPEETPPLDAQVWEAIRNSTNPADYEAYLRIFPTGAVAGLARERLKALAPARHPPASTAGPVPAAPAPAPRQKELATTPVPPPGPAPQPPASTGAPTSTTPTPAPQQQAGVAASTTAAAPVAAPQQQALVAPDLSKSVMSPVLPAAPYDGEWKGVVLGSRNCTLGPCGGSVKATVAKNAVSGKMESQTGNVQLSGTIANDGSFAGKLGADRMTGKFDEDRFEGVISSTPGSALASSEIRGVLILERVK